MKLKPPPKIKEPYLIRFRTQNQIGVWSEWQGQGQAEWQGLEHAQSQIKMLKKALINKTVEIEFTKEGKLLNYQGEETGKTLIFETR